MKKKASKENEPRMQINYHTEQNAVEKCKAFDIIGAAMSHVAYMATQNVREKFFVILLLCGTFFNFFYSMAYAIVKIFVHLQLEYLLFPPVSFCMREYIVVFLFFLLISFPTRAVHIMMMRWLHFALSICANTIYLFKRKFSLMLLKCANAQKELFACLRDGVFEVKISSNCH